MDQDHLKELIGQVAPGLETSSLQPLGEGMDSCAYLAAGFVFRFPKIPSVSRKYDAEIALLPRIADRVGVAVPRIAYTGRDPVTGFSFLGYPLIPGTPLSRFSQDTPHDAIEVLAKTLAGFLSALHGLWVDPDVRSLLWKSIDRSAMEEEYTRARREVFPLVERPVRAYIERLYQGFLADYRDTPPCLLHGDLWPEHILCDGEPQSPRVTGIIDFGDLAFGDADFDLMQLHGTWGTRLTSPIYRHLGTALIARTTASLDFFFGANSVVDVLLGIDRNDPSLIRWALEELGRRAASAALGA